MIKGLEDSNQSIHQHNLRPIKNKCVWDNGSENFR